jgi:hypothetical protein
MAPLAGESGRKLSALDPTTTEVQPTMTIRAECATLLWEKHFEKNYEEVRTSVAKATQLLPGTPPLPPSVDRSEWVAPSESAVSI